MCSKHQFQFGDFSTLPFDMVEQVLEAPSMRGFSTLPFDMVEHVLSNLSLIELARISTTCSNFRAVYRTQIPREQKARCKLAVKLCGRERIACIVALIVDLLKGEPFSEDYHDAKWNECCISADWVLHGPLPRSSAGSRPKRKPGDIRVWIMPGTQDCSQPLYGSIALTAGNWQLSRITVKVLRSGKGAVIEVVPTWDGDLEVVSLMQALLSEGLLRFVRDKGQNLEVCVRRASDGPIPSHAVLRAQVAPLLACAARYTHEHKLSGPCRIFKTNLFIGGA
jgi:hypothetical protein